MNQTLASSSVAQGAWSASPARPLAMWPYLCLMSALVLAFFDEGIRKCLPGQPVIVTGAKDALIYLAAIWIILNAGAIARPTKIWIPWVILTSLSTAFVFLGGTSPVFALGALRTYVIGPAFVFTAGVYLGVDDVARRRVVRVFVIGAIAAAVAAILQEVMRDALPPFLSVRIYKEGHSLAGGKFNESLFASPQILSQCILLGIVGLFVCWSSGAIKRGRSLTIAVLALLAIALYLARIRTGLALMLMGLAMAFVMVRYTIGFGGGKQMRAVALVLAVAVVMTLVVNFAFKGWVSSSNVNVDRDVAFYELIFQPQQILGRLFLPRSEIRRVGASHMLLGYGSGTAGALRRFLPASRIASVPKVYDTGLGMLVTEFGVVGLALFLGPMLWVLTRSLVWIRRASITPPDALWAWISSVLFLIWFLFKSHSTLENGFSQMIWIGSLGMCWGLMLRVRSWASQANATSRGAS